MAFDFPAAEVAIRNWLVSGSGLSSVIFANQNGSQPAFPYASVRIDGPFPVASLDEELQDYSAARPAGMEVNRYLMGERELVAYCQIFTQPVVNTGTAREYASKAVTALRAPAIADALRAAGLFVRTRSPIQNLDLVKAAGFEGRAAFDVTFGCVDDTKSDTTTNAVGYITTVDLDEEYT
jgi:hypothetical protein